MSGDHDRNQPPGVMGASGAIGILPDGFFAQKLGEPAPAPRDTTRVDDRPTPDPDR